MVGHPPQAVKAVNAPLRVALSGTPVENRLVELWSLFDFVSPGYLGPIKAFTQQYAAPIEKEMDAGRLASLRRVTAPFLLRRMKTDPAVAADLPPKVVRDVSATLSAPQARIPPLRRPLPAAAPTRPLLVESLI